MADNTEWKTPSMEGEGKGDGHQYGRKPRTPEPIPIDFGKSPSEEEMGHWTLTGVEPKDYDDDVDCLNLAGRRVVSPHRHRCCAEVVTEGSHGSDQRESLLLDRVVVPLGVSDAPRCRQY